MRIGIVDPDTSHTRHFVQFLRNQEDVRIVGLFDGSRIRSTAIIETFAEEFSLNIFSGLEGLSREIDAALILSADWTRHLALASMLVRENVIVFIDKPIVGSLSDMMELEILVNQNPGMIFGGSALPYTSEIHRIRALLKNENIESVRVTGPLDNFFMSIHSAELLACLVPIDASIRIEATDSGLELKRVGRAIGTIARSTSGWNLEIESRSDHYAASIGERNIYDGLLATFLRVALGEETRDLSIASNGVRIELARAKSLRLGTPIEIGGIDEGDSISAEHFIAGYTELHRQEPL